MIDRARHKMITAVMDMLESLSNEDFEKAGMYIDVELKTTDGHFKVIFEDETGDWLYRIE